MKTLVSCIGTGNMGGALMKAAASAIGGARIGVTDYDAAKARAFASEIGSSVFASNKEAALKGHFLFLAVKPQVALAVLDDLAPVLAERSSSDPLVLVSIVAGLSVANIRSRLASTPGAAAVSLPIIRLMPNTPALIGQGLIALSADSTVRAEDIAELERILSRSGLVDRVDERLMDAVTAVSGSGPAFVYLFIEALADAGVRAGLPRDKALRYASVTVRGSAAMVEETGQHPGVLKDAVCSPAGTTIAGVAVLEERGFRAAAMAAVDAAFKRAKDLDTQYNNQSAS